MIATQYINLNMVPSGYPPVVYMSQYDVGRPIGFVVSASGSTPDLDDYTVTIEGTRSDGTAVTAAVTTDGNICAFETTATMTNRRDRYPAQLVVTDGNGKRIASIPITMMVVKAAMDENAEGIEEDRSLYQQYTGTVQSLIATIRTQLNAETAARISAVSAEASARQAADNTLQSNINAEASTRSTQDASLQSQIDQLIAPSGEAPSAAEVQNARIGSDGTVYPTLGDAIRTQNSLLKSQLQYIGIKSTGYKSENLFKSNTPIERSYYWNSSGEKTYSASFAAIGPISVLGYDKLLYCNTGNIPASSAAVWVWEDANGGIVKAAHVTSSTTANELTVTVPENAVSVKISIYKTFADVFSVCGFTTGDLTDAAETIQGLSNRVSYEIIPFTGSGYIRYETGTMNPDSPQSTAGWKYAVVDCSEGDGFTINATGATNARAWCFLDANNNSLTVAGIGDVCNGTEIYAPKNAAKLVINTNDGRQSVKGVNVFDYVDRLRDELIPSYDINDTPGNGLTWDWWFSEHVIDDYGNTYVGYIDKDAYIGVMMICTDGTTRYRRLAKQPNADDHNSCGVNILSDGKIIVMSTGGHTAKDRIRVFIADQPYTVDCEFTDKSFTIPHPDETDHYYGLTYSQIFIYNGTIYDFFRCVETGGSGAPICYVKSSDLFTTFEFGIAVTSTDNYCKFKETNTDGLLRMAITKNPVQGENSILHGFLNLSTENLESDSGTVVGALVPVSASEWVSSKLSQAVHAQDSFTAVVSGGTSFKLRLLDVAKTDRDDVSILYGKSTVYASTINDFICMRYKNGVNAELAHSGMPFYKVSYYLPGCCFGWNDSVVLAAVNESTTEQDKNHVLKLIDVDGNTETVLMRSAKILIRPIYSESGLVIASSGEYNDISGTPEASGNNVFYQWRLSPVFKHV